MSDLSFKVLASQGKARRGKMSLAHGDVETPTFMPVGTYAAVKGLQPKMSILLKIKLTKPHKGLVIPRSAVLSLDEKIWVISGGSKIEVEGRYVNEFDFEITSGLNEGDTISKFFPKDNS